MYKIQSMNRSLVHVQVSPVRALDTKGCSTLRRSRRTSVVYATLDSSAAYAVSQQLAAFGKSLFHWCFALFRTGCLGYHLLRFRSCLYGCIGFILCLNGFLI